MKKSVPISTEEKIKIAINNKKESDKILRELRKQKKAEEQAVITQRHTERGAIAERLFDENAELSNEEFQKKIEDVLNDYNHKNHNTKIDTHKGELTRKHT